MVQSASDMTPQALQALIGFYAESGISELCEEAAIDRFAQSTDMAQARKTPARAGVPSAQPETGRASAASGAGGAAASPRPSSGAQRSAPPPSTPTPQASQLTIPDEAAFSDARRLAGEAGTIAELRAALQGFTGCNLRHSAKSLVFADGNPDADVMFIGEAPGRDEDLQGLPFVGRAGQMLDRMLAAIGLDRNNSYITNMIPWRPPGNRPPAPHEIELCRPFIERHIALAQPKVLVMLGNISTKALLGTDTGILSVRGVWRTFTSQGVAIPALPTLHPAYLLRNPAQKRLTWSDLMSLRQQLEDLTVETTP